MHDEVYKRLFAFPRMVEDLLRGFVRGEWIDDIDFSTSISSIHSPPKRFTPHEEQELAPAWTLEEVQMTLEERVSQWPAQWVQEGLERGLERGLEHERALLRRMAASRFGAAVAERLSGTLARIADPERLADIGEWLVRCGTGEEFLARVGSVTAEKDPREG